MADEVVNEAEVQSVQEPVAETPAAQETAAQETATQEVAAPVAAADPVAPVAVEHAPEVHKEPHKESIQQEKPVPRQSMLNVGQHDRKSTHKDYRKLSNRSTKDFRAFSRAGYMSMMSIKRGSLASFQDRQKQPKYMNSYKLNSEKPFNPDKVKSIIVKILEDSVGDEMVYDLELCPDKAKQISATIRQKVKDQDYDRYKLVCIVTIGEKKSHDILTAMRFLWDSERDRYATHFYENMYLFVVATVFGLYYE